MSGEIDKKEKNIICGCYTQEKFGPPKSINNNKYVNELTTFFTNGSYISVKTRDGVEKIVVGSPFDEEWEGTIEELIEKLNDNG